MADLLLLSMIVPLLGCLFISLSAQKTENAFKVTFFVILSEIAILLRTGALVYNMDFSYQSNYWSENNIFFSLKVNVASILLQVSVYMSLLVSLMGLDNEQRKNKKVLVTALFFGWNISGLLFSNDALTFYLFFCSATLPLLLLVSTHWQARRNTPPILFFIFHQGCSLILFFALAIILYFSHGNVLLSEIQHIDMPTEFYTIIAICTGVAFISRIPIWPFYYWISAVNTGVRNSLVHVMANLLPLTGLYGAMRLHSIFLPIGLHEIEPILEIAGLVTILLIALVGLTQQDFLQKLFAYTTIYYLLYTLAVIMLKTKYQQNIEYALFSFMLVNSVLAVLYLLMENSCNAIGCNINGILTHIPRFDNLFIFFVLIACGLPISSMFWNNFILISSLFHESFISGLCVMLAITFISMSLIYELYIMQDLEHNNTYTQKIADMEDISFMFFMVILIVLVISFFNPLWFIF